MSNTAETELLARLADCPRRGSWWTHRRGALVRVVCCSLDEATLEPLVTYRHAQDDMRPLSESVLWTRPLAAFLERFIPEL